MERSMDRFYHRGSVSRAACSREVAGWPDATVEEQGVPVGLLVVLAGEIVGFAALAASGNMPAIVSVLYRALLTL
ncbi:MAG: hypothetical protein IPP07_06485 [Holophagales bacterium]|nr:hypothetical protein [Holophagales bacterium]